MNVDKLDMFRLVKEKSESFVFLECQQDPIQSFYEYEMDWCIFWNTLNFSQYLHCPSQEKSTGCTELGDHTDFRQ